MTVGIVGGLFVVHFERKTHIGEPRGEGLASAQLEAGLSHNSPRNRSVSLKMGKRRMQQIINHALTLDQNAECQHDRTNQPYD